MAGHRASIDFGKLAAALLDRADSLVAQWLPRGVERAGRWYVGDFDGSPGESANVNLRTGQWIDNSAPDEDKGGDLISLYARINNLNNGQAARELMEQMGWARRDDDDRPPVRTPAHHAPARLASDVAAPPADAVAGEAPALDQAGGDDRPDPPAGDATAPVPSKRKSKWRAMTPVPPHAPAPSFRFGYRDDTTGRWVELDAARTWEYEFEGERLGYVARFERISSTTGELVKDTVPLTWCTDESDGRRTQRWHWKQWEAPRPLYVPATLLACDPTVTPVVVVEGEKCAWAGFELMGHEFDFVSWPGGCKAWALAHWGWLMGRTVYLWADCDAQHERLTKAEKEAGVEPRTKPLRPEPKQPGMAAMVSIGQLLQADYGCTVYLCQIPKPGTKPDGWDIADAIAEGWQPDQVRAFIRAAVPFVAPNDEARAKVAGQILTPSRAGAEKVEEPAEDAWRSRLLETDKKAIKAARENVVLALDGIPELNLPGIPDAAGVIAFNEFTNDVIKLKPPPWGTAAGVWDEVDELELGNWLTRTHWLPPMSRQTLEEAVSMVARRHRYHPVRDKLQGLQGTWDNTPRLKTWLARCCWKGGVAPATDPKEAADARRYMARVGTWLVMAICARVLTPGCKFDYMTIFEGKQGLGKSTLANLLALGAFADTGLVLRDKDSYQNLQGVLVYEWGELDALTRAEVTHVKQFISSKSDRFRASFDKRAKDYPRQVVFIGTTNESHYLSDPTGNRRFWPVKVTRQIDLDWVREHLDQLFAEALHYVAQGWRFYPTWDEQLKLFDPQQMERTVESSLEAAIRKYLYDEGQRVSMTGLNGALVNEVSLGELLGALGITVDKQTAQLTKQASAALGRIGWERHRGRVMANGTGNKSRPWVYRRPPDTPADAESGDSDDFGGSAGSSENNDIDLKGSVQSHQPAGADSDCPF